MDVLSPDTNVTSTGLFSFSQCVMPQAVWYNRAPTGHCKFTESLKVNKWVQTPSNCKPKATSKHFTCATWYSVHSLGKQMYRYSTVVVVLVVFVVSIVILSSLSSSSVLSLLLSLAFLLFYFCQGADKSLACPGRKQATNSNFCKPLKNSESCPSNQVSTAAMTSASDEKWRAFNFFSVGSG